MVKPRPHSAKKRGVKRGRPNRGGESPYYVQPGKRGVMVVLRKACGNRATAKVCGVMPTRAHAIALVEQLVRAESTVNDLFYEATDDGMEALETILATCRESVLSRIPVPEGMTLEVRSREAGEVLSEPATDRAVEDDLSPG